MPSLVTAVLVVLLAILTLVGILTTNHDHSQRPSVGNSGVVLYGGR